MSSWKFFLRQMFISSGVWSGYFTFGLCLGYPTVLISQLRDEANSTAVVSEEMASWLPSLCVWASIPWICLLPLMTKYYGRRKLYIFICTSNFIGFVIFYFSRNLTHITISTLFNGVNFSGYIVLIITEYTSPKYRGVFLCVKTATNFWSIWVANALGVYFHWKTIGILALVCNVYSLSVILVLPESPYWLAQKGEFEESSAVMKWLMGSEKEADEAFVKMMKYHKENVVDQEAVPLFSGSNLRNVFKTMKKREFYMPIILSNMLVGLFLLSGKTVISVYAIEILTKVTGTRSSAQTAMLILKGVTVLSVYIGIVLSRYLKRRTLLLISSMLGNFFLFVTSLYLYLIHLSIIPEFKYISVGLLACFSSSMSVGVVILCITVSGELIALERRSLSMFIVTVTFKFCMASLIKLTPYILKYYGVHGAFFLFAMCSSILLVCLYIYLPETKDKTLEQIAESLNVRKGKSFGELKKLISGKREV